jgi:flagellar protein FliO/FliZ
MAQVFFSLVLVVAAILVVVWLLKRMNVVQQSTGNLLKVLGGVAIGQRERVVLLEIDDTWLVIGVGPGQIRTLHTLPKSSHATNDRPAHVENNFNVWLKKFIEKRNAA